MDVVLLISCMQFKDHKKLFQTIYDCWIFVQHCYIYFRESSTNTGEQQKLISVSLSLHRSELQCIWLPYWLILCLYTLSTHCAHTPVDGSVSWPDIHTAWYSHMYCINRDQIAVRPAGHFHSVLWWTDPVQLVSAGNAQNKLCLIAAILQCSLHSLISNLSLHGLSCPKTGWEGYTSPSKKIMKCMLNLIAGEPVITQKLAACRHNSHSPNN